MISAIDSFVLHGVEAHDCRVEVAVSPDHKPSATVVGLPDAAVRESIERVRAAIESSGYPFPFGRVVINLAPGDLRKEGPVYDLPIALALLGSSGVVTLDGMREARGMLIAGELALDGGVRSVRGIIGLGVLASSQDRAVIVPQADAAAAKLVDGLDVRGALSLSSVVEHLNGRHILPVAASEPPAMQAEAALPLESIKGQESAKRALIVSAAGWHNLIMLGPPGCGKTLMARALADLLPPLDRESLMEILQIRSCAGHVNIDEFTRARRPVRTPHHTASGPAIIGGGTCPHPGEVSLAHHGILFLDELPEFGRRVLEALRQPLEDHAVTVARVSGTVRFPARFLLVAAANPSYRNSGLAGADRAYMSRLSSPLLDRVDLHVEVRPVPVRRLKSQVVTGPATNVARKMVRVAVERQHARQGTSPNGMLDGRQLDEYARLSPEAEEMLAQSVESLGLSARGWDTIRRVARTIADLDDRNLIDVSDVAEAVSYRLLDRACGP